MMNPAIMAGELLSARHVIGLDIGDGESALVWSSTDHVGSANVYQRRNTAETSILTALSRVPRQHGKYLFGEEALLAKDSVQFRVNFKERPAPGVTPDAVLFGQALLKEFFEVNPGVEERCLIFIGHPAGWPEDVIEEYRRYLQHVGSSVYLLAESQSALVYVRDRSAVDPKHLDNVLVIDIGSSTVDITIVEDMFPRNFDVGVDLGCRQIDEELAAMVKEALAENPKFIAALTRNGSEDFLLLACRRAKEAQFSRRAQNLLDTPASFAPGRAEIADFGFGWLKDQEIPNIVTRPGGWGSRFEDLMRRVSDYLAKPPAVVILTGGGSRMPFVWDICAQAFPGAAVNRDKDPSLSVSHGLASAGNQRVQVARFRHDISAIARSAETSAYIHLEAERAFRASKESLVAALRSQHQDNWPRLVEKPPGQEEVIDDFQSSISSYLVPRVQDVCAKYGIDSSRFGMDLTLPPFFAKQLIASAGGYSFQAITAELERAGRAPSVQYAGMRGIRKAFEVGTSKLSRDPKAFAVGVAVTAVGAAAIGGGAMAVTWYQKEKIIGKVLAYEMPSEAAEELTDKAIAKVYDMMNERASAVERFVT